MSEIQRPEDSLRKMAEAFFSELESRFECDPPDRRVDAGDSNTRSAFQLLTRRR